MRESFSTPRNRIRTLIFLVICGLSAVGAAVVGIDDNPIGIGLTLLSGFSLVLACVQTWRRVAQFRRLTLASLLGLVLLLVLGVALQVLVERGGVSGLPGQILGVVGTIFLLGGPFLCIPGLLVGLVGSLLMRKRGRDARPAA
jgi:hypothetical protein